MRFFPEEIKTTVIQRVARLEAVSVETLQELDDQLCKELEKVGRMGQKLGGAAHAAAILNELQKDGESIMDNLEDRDPNLTEEIRSQMFRFEDLTEMDGDSYRHFSNPHRGYGS